MKKKCRRESGQAMVLFCIVFVVLIGILALAVDYGMPAWTARKLQNAADSAALAAATKLPADSVEAKNDATAEAVKYAGKNGYSNVDVSFSGSGFTVVDVTVKDTVQFSFAKIFGKNEIDVARSAAAQLKAVTGVRGAVPLSVEKNELDNAIASGNCFLTLKFGGGSGNEGAYGALDLDGSNGGGASQYKDRLINGYDGLISVGDSIPTENGNMSGPTEQGIQQRYDACTHYTSSGGCTAEHYEKDCPRVMLVPVVVYTSAHQVEVKGFAPFLLDSYHGSGNQCFVYGTYLKSYITDGSVDSSVPESTYGPYTVKLVK